MSCTEKSRITTKPMEKTAQINLQPVNEHDPRVTGSVLYPVLIRSADMSKLKLKATAFCVFAAFTISLSSPPSAFAHKGAMGIVKERMDKFEASEKATKRIKQALSRGDTAVIIAEAEFLVSWAREMEGFFPENSNQPPSEAKDDIWRQWDKFVGAIQSFDNAAQALIDDARGEDPRAIGQAFKEMTKSCKSCHRQFRED